MALENMHIDASLCRMPGQSLALSQPVAMLGRDWACNHDPSRKLWKSLRLPIKVDLCASVRLVQTLAAHAPLDSIR